MQRIKILLGASTALVLAACSGAAQGPPKTSSVSVSSSSYAKLQFAVGTATIYGVANAGLNVVSTYRQANGTSAVLVSTPTITGPFTLPAAAAAAGADSFATAPAGPSYTETLAGGELTGTPQSLRLGTPACDTAALTGACPGTYTPNTSTFGQSGGVFAMGLQPSNYQNTGEPYTYSPYSEPLFDGSADAFVPWGGPPAYDPDGHGMGARDGINNLGSIDGVNEGLTTFDGVIPTSGAYTLALQVPTGISSSGVASYTTIYPTGPGTGTNGAFTLNDAIQLPPITAPVLVEDGTGGGTFTVTLPAGVTEALIQVSDYGDAPLIPSGSSAYSCQGELSPIATEGEGFPVVYTIVVKQAGTSTVTLPDAIGPNLDAGKGAGKYAPSPTLCTAAQNQAVATAAGDTTSVVTGDFYTVQIVGADYPIYEASPIFGGETPTIVGATGQADITISTGIGSTVGYGTNGGFTPYSGPRKGAKSVRRAAAVVKHVIGH